MPGSEARRRKVRALIVRDALVVCWVCGRPIDRAAAENDHGQLSVDHVVPRRLGGGNELENLRLAHKGCNERRDREDRLGSDRLEEVA